MEKIAELVKQAEVNGVIAALCDAGYVEMDEDTFGKVAEHIAGELPENYDLEAVLSKTAEVMEALETEAEATEETVKEAAEETVKEAAEETDEVDQTAVMAAYGELSMQKMAGDIDEETFEKEAANLKNMMTGAKIVKDDVVNAAKGVAGKVSDASKDKLQNLKASLNKGKDAAKAKATEVASKAKDVATSPAAKLTGAAAGGAAAGVGGKALYDKYKK